MQHDKLLARLDFRDQEFEWVQRTIESLRKAAELQEAEMAEQSSGQAVSVCEMKRTVDKLKTELNGKLMTIE